MFRRNGLPQWNNAIKAETMSPSIRSINSISLSEINSPRETIRRTNIKPTFISL